MLTDIGVKNPSHQPAVHISSTSVSWVYKVPLAPILQLQLSLQSIGSPHALMPACISTCCLPACALYACLHEPTMPACMRPLCRMLPMSNTPCRLPTRPCTVLHMRVMRSAWQRCWQPERM